MTVIGSCGHEIGSIFSGKSIAKKAIARDGSKCISYEVVCDECYKFLDKNRYLLYTRQEEKNYLKGNIKYMEDENRECPFCGKQPEWYYNQETLWCVTPECPMKGLIFSEEEWNDRYDSV